MVHDAAEHFTGDMPRWTKQQKGLRGILSELEAEVLESKQLLCDLDEPDTLWLEAADLLDAWLFLRQNVLAGNRLMQPDYERATRTLRTMDCPIEIRNVFEFLLWRNT
jgi:5'-deoxynucleotidase YfbR-like HD superfamily hydrolase